MSESRNELLLMVGLPRSGKSTYAKSLIGSDWAIVNPDSIRLALTGQRYVEEIEPYVWAIAKTMVVSLFNAGHKKVVFDATNTTKKRRDFWKDDRWDIYYRHINTDKETCIERAKATNQLDLIPVIEKMAAEWEPVYG
jgi:predicted kinase